MSIQAAASAADLVGAQGRLRGWLASAYDFIGAHHHPQRLANERDRALQRMTLPVASVAWIVVFHQMMSTSVTPAEAIWCVGAIAYACASAAFRLHITRHPAGGVHAQYAFLIGDPLIVGWALYAAPEPLAWWLVLLLVMIVRVGLRYGLNAMKVELAVAWIAAALPLIFGSYWHVQLQMTASLVLMLVSTWWLFAPLNRSLEKAKHLEIEKARIDSLQETLAAKSEFLSRVSHELRSPLQGLLSAVELFELTLPRGPTEAELLSRIRRGATSLNAQIRDLLTLARGEVGKVEIHPMPFEVCELVNGVAREVVTEAADKGLRLIVQTPSEPIYVVADAGRIDQVLTNLLTNAIRHTRQGEITLACRGYDDERRCLLFSVKDTGPGVSADRIPTLFEPFTRVGEITGKEEGTGLGLAVVQSVLSFLGGSVTVTSEIGSGTEFIVDVPAELLDGDAPRETPETSRRRVLIVDDRPEVLQGLTSVIEQLGVRCDRASSAAIAANLLGARVYSAVFIDLQMPVKTGLDLASETRRGKGPNAATRLFSISASDAPMEAQGWPFDGHLSKPITKNSLQHAIEQRAHPAVGRR